MNDIEGKIIDRLNGNLNDTEWNQVLKDSKDKPEFQELYHQYIEIFDQIENISPQPTDAEMQKRFDSFLDQEISAETSNVGKSKTFKIIPQYFQQAAIFMLLLAVGLLIGLNIKNSSIIDSYVEQANDHQQDMLQLLSNESSSDRIKAVNMSYNLESPHNDIVDALIKTLHHDQSENVRLAAAEALAKFENNTNVRQALIHSLEIESDEHLQIALINILAQMNEKGAIETIDKIIENDQSVKFVKDVAHSGKLKLIETY